MRVGANKISMKHSVRLHGVWCSFALALACAEEATEDKAEVGVMPNNNAGSTATA
jgi:hypothetical protein